MISTAQVIENARTWLGVRFVHQGRSRHGVDCLGFVAAMMHELGSDVFLDHLPVNYARSPQASLTPGLQAVTCEIPLQPGALIIVQWANTPCPSHAAIYTDTNTLIHCNSIHRKVIEHGYRGPWVTRTASIWALPLVTYP